MSTTTAVYPTFTAPPAVVANTDYEKGRQAYLQGRRYPDCTSQEMRDGWTAAAGDGADCYYRAMMAAASAAKCVNWNSEAVR